MQKLTITTASAKSEIYCGKGSLDKIAPSYSGKKLFIVTDSHVYKLYKSSVIDKYFPEAPVHVIKAGEASKNYLTLMEILKDMLRCGVTRSCTLIALGGGVVGDIGGLAACLYMRGVNLVQIPTTLLSQVDSSVGGKTAVDLGSVKNAVGAFYQPSQVIVDPLFLSTLPLRQLRCGLGEIVKYGALNKKIFGMLTLARTRLFDEWFLEDITYPCICHKAAVVEKDEKDTLGIRKSLNLGHTTGHALELYYKRRTHGEFVLIGMYYELFIAKKLGICGNEYAEALEALIKKVIGKIPVFPDIETAVSGAKYDKKNTDQAEISLILPVSEGECREAKMPVFEYVTYIKECAELIERSGA